MLCAATKIDQWRLAEAGRAGIATAATIPETSGGKELQNLPQSRKIIKAE